MDLIHKDFVAAKNLIYTPLQLTCSEPRIETESREYGACEFKLNGLSVKFRVAKTTPTKIGQFVTLWKRNHEGITVPHDLSDSFDLYIISTRQDHNFGQFIFPKSELGKQSILSVNGKGGKRGIRVYPPWDETTNKQAQKTQEWQIKYFLELPPNGIADASRLKALLNIA